MKIVELQQGSAEWHAHRASHFNASDAPAMLGCSAYKTRQQLLRELATGAAKDVDPATQRIFDDGHRFEALARPLAETIIEESLYPVVGCEGKLSASFDGITMTDEIAFEHKSLNNDLRVVMVGDYTGADLPKQYRVQMEQQHMVSGCEKILFMASKFDSDDNLVEERHCWYLPDADLRNEIMQGWAQFAEDLAVYQHIEAEPEVVAAPVLDLPAVSVQMSGAISILDNFEVFDVALRDFIENQLIRKPETDQDFANLEAQIKTLKKAEAALDAAEAYAMSQVASIDAMKRTKDMLHKLTRDNRLMAEKLFEAEKVNRKAAILDEGKKAFAEHVAAINATLAPLQLPAINADFVGVTKGLRSMDSAKDKVAAEVARVKIEANRIADLIRANLKSLRELAADHKFLFSDTVHLVLKPNDDLVNLIKLRISEHKAEEQAKADALREQIRQEEEAKARAEAEAKVRAEIAAKEAQERAEGDSKAKQDDAENAKRESTEVVHAIADIIMTAEDAAAFKGAPIPADVRQQAPIQRVMPALRTRPTDTEIVEAVAIYFAVTNNEAANWLQTFNMQAEVA